MEHCKAYQTVDGSFFEATVQNTDTIVSNYTTFVNPKTLASLFALGEFNDRGL
jgi:hypothetical protein